MRSVGELTTQEEAEAEEISNKRHENLELYTSPTWGAAPVEPIATKFGKSLPLTDVIIRSKFGIDWQSSFGFGEIESLPSPLGTQICPYHMQPFGLAGDRHRTLIWQH